MVNKALSVAPVVTSLSSLNVLRIPADRIIRCFWRQILVRMRSHKITLKWNAAKTIGQVRAGLTD